MIISDLQFLMVLFVVAFLVFFLFFDSKNEKPANKEIKKPAKTKKVFTEEQRERIQLAIESKKSNKV